MRGFNIGDELQTKDGKHKGTVIKIDTERDEEGNYDFKITIDEGNYKIYKDTIHNFNVF